MTIQYNHRRKFTEAPPYFQSKVSPQGGETIALEVPAAWFLNYIQPGDFFEKKVGTARCSDDDNYNKKTGRELATSRMKTKKMTCISVTPSVGYGIVVLKDEQGNTYTLRISDNNPHFVGYNE